MRLDAHLFGGRSKSHALCHTVFQKLHVQILKLMNTFAVKADQMVVVRMIHKIRVIDLAPLPQIQLTQQAAVHKNGKGAIDRGTTDRRFSLARHVEQFIRSVMPIGAKCRLDDRITLRGLAKPPADKELANLIAYDLFHGLRRDHVRLGNTPRTPQRGQDRAPRAQKISLPPPAACIVHRMPASQDELKRRAAVYAVRFVEPGMTVGLGTGSTAIHAVREIARRHAAGELAGIRTVSTSSATAKAAREAGLPSGNSAEFVAIDITIDGADEADPQLNLIKGGGGALLHEKIVAQATRREIIVVDESKLSAQLGTRCPLPVEVFPFQHEAQRALLETLGGRPVLRSGVEGGPFITDEGNLIYDCPFGPLPDPEELAAELDARSGVACHGLFLGLTDDLIIADASGLRHRQYDPASDMIREIPVK